jgi:hypothetical protein
MWVIKHERKSEIKSREKNRDLCEINRESMNRETYAAGTAHGTFKIGSINIVKIKNPSNAWLAYVYLGAPSLC